MQKAQRTQSLRLVSKVLEFKQNDGIIVDNSRRHDFMTVLKWEEITPRDREWMKTLSAEQQIVVLPARLPNEVAVEKGALVEVQAKNWIPAVVTSDAFHDQVWVSVEGKQMEVDKSKIRARFDPYLPKRIELLSLAFWSSTWRRVRSKSKQAFNPTF